MTNLYRTLGVRRTATAKAIATAYRRLILKYHPDRNPPGDAEAAANYAAVDLAHAVLSDPDRRARYDATGDTSAPREHGEYLDVLRVLTPIVVGVVESIVTQGGSLGREDVVRHVRQQLEKRIRDIEKSIATGRKVAAGLRSAAARLTTVRDEDGAEPENILAASAKSQAAGIEARLKMNETELAAHRKSLEFLASYRYTVDDTGWTSSSAVFGSFTWHTSG